MVRIIYYFLSVKPLSSTSHVTVLKASQEPRGLKAAANQLEMASQVCRVSVVCEDMVVKGAKA